MATITLTFGECAENHAGMQRLGARAAEGFTPADLADARARFEDAGYVCELVDLVAAARVEGPKLAPEPACLLVVRGGAGAFGRSADALSDEQDGFCDLRDTKALMRGRVVNKRARHNLCFAPEAQEPDYEAGRGRVIAFASAPELDGVRRALPDFFGTKAADLYAEGNYYYDVRKCGIGYHGDSERRRIVALRFGADMPLCFQWYLGGEPVGRRVAFVLGHGDLYAFSEKAAGTDWKRRLVPTLRHAAGAPKYVGVGAEDEAEAGV